MWVQAQREKRQITKFGTRMLRKEEMRCWNHWLGLVYERNRLRSYGKRLQGAGLSRGEGDLSPSQRLGRLRSLVKLGQNGERQHIELDGAWAR